MQRAQENEYHDEHMPTIGVEFGSFVIKIDDDTTKLQIWDTAGQETFRSICRVFYRRANCVFLTYDITNEHSFTNIEDWLRETRQHSEPGICLLYTSPSPRDQA